MPSFNQQLIQFTPPTQGSGYSQGLDFVPAWLQINNPSSYYLTFPNMPGLGAIPPYTTGTIVPWNQTGLAILVSTGFSPANAPSLPVSNSPVTILATDNPDLGASPGIALPSFEQGQVIATVTIPQAVDRGAWSPTVTYSLNEYVTYGGDIYYSQANENLDNVPSSSSPYWAFNNMIYATTLSLSSNATGIAFLSNSNAGGNLTKVLCEGNTTSYPYISEYTSGGFLYNLWLTSPVIGNFEQIAVLIGAYGDDPGLLGWIIELYGNQLTFPVTPVSQPLAIVGTGTQINPINGNYPPPVGIQGYNALGSNVDVVAYPSPVQSCTSVEYSSVAGGSNELVASSGGNTGTYIRKVVLTASVGGTFSLQSPSGTNFASLIYNPSYGPAVFDLSSYLLPYNIGLYLYTSMAATITGYVLSDTLTTPIPPA